MNLKHPTHNCQAPFKKTTHLFTDGSKKISAQFDLSAKIYHCIYMNHHKILHQHNHLSAPSQAPTTKPIQVVFGGKEYWNQKTAKRSYGQEEFFINPSPCEREVPFGYSRSKHGLARQINAIRSKSFKTYLQLIAIESEFGSKKLYGSRKHFADKLGVNVKTIGRWDKILVSLKLIKLRHRPGQRTNQKNVSKAMGDNSFLALLDGVSLRRKKVINNLNPNVPLSITYGKDINIFYELENKERLNTIACAHVRNPEKDNTHKREELERKKEVLLREPQNKWMNYYFNSDTHTLPVNLKEVRSWMILAARVRVPVPTARALCDVPPRMFSNADRVRLSVFSVHVLRRATADLNASEYFCRDTGRYCNEPPVDSYAVLYALCMFYSSDMELPRNLKFAKVAKWVDDNSAWIQPLKVADDIAQSSPFWFYSCSPKWLQRQIKIITTWKDRTERKGYELPVAHDILIQLEDYLDWVVTYQKPIRKQPPRPSSSERNLYESAMRTLSGEDPLAHVEFKWDFNRFYSSMMAFNNNDSIAEG